MMFGAKLARAAEKMKRKPDTKAGKQVNVMRYVLGADNSKKAKLPTDKPEKTK